MRSLMRSLVVLGAMGVSAAASAGSVTNATITKLVMGTNEGDYVFIQVNVAKSSNPSCSTSSLYSFAFPLSSTTENQMLALLLSARATQTPVALYGTGLCSNFSNIETLEIVEY